MEQVSDNSVHMLDWGSICHDFCFLIFLWN